ncbi:MAG TPA: LuxR family transcriptional regulator, partial [Candidatus Atribacteria bacterium]|nr:LuxR family transcriptional regulator [Candidatus Atribacteria bacterium]
MNKKTDYYGIDNALKERIKEFNCIYNLTAIIKDRSISIEEALQKIVDIIP